MVSHTHLKRARMPIPPLSHELVFTTRVIIAGVRRFVNNKISKNSSFSAELSGEKCEAFCQKREESKERIAIGNSE